MKTSDDPPEDGPTLSDLAAASGVEPRTIRSWVAQGLLPPPLVLGPGARYPMEAMQRLLAIVAMREDLGMSLPDIRRDLLVADAGEIASHAARFARRRAPQPASRARNADGRDALDYIARLRGAAGHPPTARPPPDTGLAALEQRLGGGLPPSARRARAETWLRVPVTPDVEISVKGPLDAEQRARLERCADLLRDILLGTLK